MYTVNGQVTDDLRRCWGIEKSRDNHVHHAVDAIVISCITRTQYDRLARFYHDYEIKALEQQLQGLYALPNKNGAPVPIKKVRVYSKLTNPIELKEQRDKSTKMRKAYKERYYVNNDSNYVLEIFDGEKRREFELYKNIEAANGKVPDVGGDAVCLQKGQHVLLYKDCPDEVWACSPAEVVKRFYIVQGLSSMTLQKKYRYGVVVLKHALEGRLFSDLKVQDGDFEPDESYMPLRKFLHTRFKALVEGRDFMISPLGELRRLCSC